MRHFDYDWDLGPGYIKFDPELNIDKVVKFIEEGLRNVQAE